jgi:hypothetical protein
MRQKKTVTSCLQSKKLPPSFSFTPSDQPGGTRQNERATREMACTKRRQKLLLKPALGRIYVKLPLSRLLVKQMEALAMVKSKRASRVCVARTSLLRANCHARPLGRTLVPLIFILDASSPAFFIILSSPNRHLHHGL